MMPDKSLAKTVVDCLNQANTKPLFSQAALDALTLSEKFESVTAREYVLPLDVLAGFPRQARFVPDEM